VLECWSAAGLASGWVGPVRPRIWLLSYLGCAVRQDCRDKLDCIRIAGGACPALPRQCGRAESHSRRGILPPFPFMPEPLHHPIPHSPFPGQRVRLPLTPLSCCPSPSKAWPLGVLDACPGLLHVPARVDDGVGAEVRAGGPAQSGRVASGRVGSGGGGGLGRGVSRCHLDVAESSEGSPHQSPLI
jgi:hypothetical protein